MNHEVALVKHLASKSETRPIAKTAAWYRSIAFIGKAAWFATSTALLALMPIASADDALFASAVGLSRVSILPLITGFKQRAANLHLVLSQAYIEAQLTSLNDISSDTLLLTVPSLTDHRIRIRYYLNHGLLVAMIWRSVCNAMQRDASRCETGRDCCFDESMRQHGILV